MFDSSLDSERLKRDIAQLVLDCISLKTVLRTTWTRPMADEQKRHCVVRRRLTERFVLLASSRGKLHVTGLGPDPAQTRGPDAVEYQRSVAMRLAPEYAMTGEVRV